MDMAEAIAIKERPILMSAPMVLAILAGRKTQTRRIVKPQAGPHCIPMSRDGLHKWLIAETGHGVSEWFRCPYGVPGERLWVKERFCVGYPTGEPGHWTALPYSGCEAHRRAFYLADGGDPPDGPQRYWKSSMFMPRWASRLTLEITDIRLERLQEINMADVIAEGITERDGAPIRDVVAGWHEPYARLWDSLNMERAPWASNPWVWIVEFRKQISQASTR